MKLYYSPGACSLSPHIALCEAGIAADLVKVNLGTKKTETGADFKAVNPDGYVPVLMLDDGSVLTEGPAIVQYIADRAPERALAPPNGSIERYRLQSMLNFISTELHKTLGALFNPEISDDWRRSVHDLLARRLTHVESTLTQSPYIMGERYSVADCYLFTVLSWTRLLKVDLAPWPGIADYLQRIAARPAVQEALRAEGLL